MTSSGMSTPLELKTGKERGKLTGRDLTSIGKSSSPFIEPEGLHGKERNIDGSPARSETNGGNGTGLNTPSDVSENEDFEAYGDEDGSKSAFYDYASEKSLRHTESKLFYLRHQLEHSQQENEAQSSLSRSRTFSSLGAGETNLSRTPSNASKRSSKTFVPREKVWRPVQGTQGSRPFTSQDATQTSLDAEIAGDLENADMDQASIDGLEPHHRPSFSRDQEISPELTGIALNIKNLLDLRHKYIDISCQAFGANPRDDPDHWRIYPSPPNPTWDDNKNRPVSQSSATGDHHSPLATSATTTGPNIQSAKQRKPGHDIGQDFYMKDLEPLPAEDRGIDFFLDSSSLYQIRHVSKRAETKEALVKTPTLRDFYKDMNKVQNVSSDGPTKSFAYRQLDILEGRFHLYSLVNGYQETADCKKVPRRDTTLLLPIFQLC